MPDNVLRVVLNSGNGRWYRFERDGDRLQAMASTGWTVLTSGVNKIHVYRVTDERGAFQTMVASAEHPAELKVYVTDPATGNLALKEEVSATAFSTDHIEFTLAGDYSGDGGAVGNVIFADGTVGAVTASFSTALLYEKRTSDSLDKVGTWKILSAAVANLSDKRIRFESSNPSVCRIERGEISSAYLKLASSQEQADQYCVLVGTGVGTCTVYCYAEADEGLSPASVTVEVRTHPDDAPQPKVSSGLAVEAKALLDNVRVSVAAKPARYFAADADEAYIIDERRIDLPGDPEDLLTFALTFTGTVPKYGDGTPAIYLLLIVGFENARRLGQTTGTNADSKMERIVNASLDVACAVPINSSGSIGDTEVLNVTRDIAARGGDRLVLAWAISNIAVGGSLEPIAAVTEQLPDGVYTAMMNCGTVTHYTKNQAP